MAEMSVDERWRELVGMYGEKSDEELVELRADFDDLTEMAQSVLRDEMRRRGIWERTAAGPLEAAESDEDDSPDTGEWMRYDRDTILLAGVVIHECVEDRERALCAFLLHRAKIQCVVPQGGGQLKVPPDDVERAIAVLERGASPAVLAEFESQYAAEQGDEGFEVPVCAQCGSTEVMLESVEPVNQWACGDCGAEWQDSGVDEAVL